MSFPRGERSHAGEKLIERGPVQQVPARNDRPDPADVGNVGGRVSV